MFWLWLLVIGVDSKSRNTAKFLPGATPLIFDTEQTPLKSISIDALNSTVWQTYNNVQIHHFRRLPISIKLPVPDLSNYARGAAVNPRLSLAVSIELRHDVLDSPVLLLERSRFGGANGIRHDTSNFCSWLHGNNPRMSSLSITTDIVSDTGRVNAHRASATVSEDYTLYLGFSGTTAWNLIHFDLAVKLVPETDVEDIYPPTCAAFEKFDQAPSTVHNQRRVSLPNLEVITRDIVIRRWTDLPTSFEVINSLTPVVEAKLARSSFSVTLQGNHILAIGVDLPSVPERTDNLRSWSPTLTLMGLPPGAADVLVGSYKAQSVWELQRFKHFAIYDDVSGPRTWLVPLKGIITHLQLHSTFLSPPGTSLLILILPRVRDALIVDGQISLLSPEHSHHIAEIEPIIDGANLQSIVFSLFGVAVGVGIVRAFWLVMTRIPQLQKSNPQARQIIFRIEEETEEELAGNERTPLINQDCHLTQLYDISSHPGGNNTHRSTSSL